MPQDIRVDIVDEVVERAERNLTRLNEGVTQHDRWMIRTGAQLTLEVIAEMSRS